jgi:hypothetical protein
MANTGSRLVELQLLAAQGKGGDAAIMELGRLADGTLPDDERSRIEGALSGIMGQAASVPAEIDVPEYDPRSPRHERIRSAWAEYALAERHFIEDNADAEQRFRNAKLPQSLIMWAIENKNPQILYYLSDRSSGNLVRWFSHLPPHEQRAELERLAHELLYSKKIPQAQRGSMRLGDMNTDSYLDFRANGNRAGESPKQTPRDDVDAYLQRRKGERKDLRRLKGHR